MQRVSLYTVPSFPYSNICSFGSFITINKSVVMHYLLKAILYSDNFNFSLISIFPEYGKIEYFSSHLGGHITVMSL